MAGEVIPMLREPFEASPLQAPPETYNTHLTYLDARGVPQKARWEDRRWGFDEVVAVGDMEDGRENRYLPVDFTGSQRPQGWPRCWRYPSNPSHLARKCENDPRSFFPCYLCGATVLGACRCSIPVPRVEIVYHGRSRGRAIRSLRRIQKDQLIGEYIGRFIPLGTQSRFAGRAEEAYAMTFDGQPPPDGSNAPGIATLVSYHYGNWSRFMNAPSRNQRAQWAATGNVRFTSEVIAEQLRICVFANEEIEFGAELVVSYGEEYG
ncbi:hypothetical protein PVAG01_11068 [Phlyctema vagabunda]|uniref:SET domain-containing protein n=1 Tax=Phlyctema vagabunda TaxID=108571 RepID=A0ABR4P439_9HELO